MDGSEVLGQVVESLSLAAPLVWAVVRTSDRWLAELHAWRKTLEGAEVIIRPAEATDPRPAGALRDSPHVPWYNSATE